MSDNAQTQSASNAVPIFLFLIFQTSKRYDFDSVWACVSHAATCHDNHQIGLAQLRGGLPYGRPGARRCGNGPLRLGMGRVQVPGLRQEGTLRRPYREIAAI